MADHRDFCDSPQTAPLIQDIAEKFFNDEQEIIRNGRPIIDREERTIDQRTKKEIWLSTTKLPWYVGGEIRGVVGIGRDTTERYALRRATLELIEASDVGGKSLLDLIVDRAVTLLKARSGGLYQYQPDEHNLRLVASKDRPSILGDNIPDDQGIAGYIVQTGKPSYVVGNYEQWDGKIPAHAETGMLGTVLAVALKVNQKLFGVLYVDRPVGENYTSNEIDILKLFGEQAAVAMQNSALLASQQVSAELLAVNQIDFKSVSREYLKRRFDDLVDRAVRLLSGNGGKVYLLNSTRDKLELMAIQGKLAEIFKPGEFLGLEEGVAGALVKDEKKRFLIENDYANSKYRIDKYVPYMSAVMEVPLKVDGETIGVLGVFADNTKRTFSEGQDTDTLIALAQQAAFAFGNAQLYDSAKRRISGLEIVANVYSAIGSDIDKDAQKALDVLVKEIAEKLECTHCTIFLPEVENNETLLVCRATYGIGVDYIRNRKFRVGEGVAGNVFQSGMSIRLDDATQYPSFSPATRVTNKPRSMLASPIIESGRIIGVITADQDKYGWFNDDHLRLLDTVASQAGIALAIANATHRPTQVFISYSRKDYDAPDKPMEKLMQQLRILELNGQIKLWIDQKAIPTGALWLEYIAQARAETEIAVLLVSSNYLDSPVIRKHELEPMLMAAADKKVKLCWIAVSDCLYKEVRVRHRVENREIKLEDFNCANTPTQPLESLSPDNLKKVVLSIGEKIARMSRNQ